VTRVSKPKRPKKPGKQAQIIAKVLYAVQAQQPCSPHRFMQHGLDFFAANFTSNKNLNGAVLQALVEECLRVNGVLPFYSEVTMQFIPVARYDIIVYTHRFGPINLSLKTTLRERWKQAEFEGMALRRVHRRARVYVVNNSPSETETRRGKRNQCEAIRDFVVCTSTDFDRLIADLKSWRPKQAPTLPVVKRGREAASIAPLVNAEVDVPKRRPSQRRPMRRI